MRSAQKKEKLNELLESYKLRIFRKKEFLPTYLGSMKKIESCKGFFTSLDLSLESGIVVGSCRNIIIKFRKKGLIKCIKPYSRHPHASFARYILR